MTVLRLTIAVLTFRRPAILAQALPVILAHADALRLPDRTVAATVLVVDNDPDQSARSSVGNLGTSAGLRYVAEPTPGIAAARNRALDESLDDDLLVFIDDDEVPTEDWLAPLVATWSATGAAAVMGRVVSEFGSPVDPWVAAGEFFRRRRMASETDIRVGAAGNLLLDRQQVRRLLLRFDERLGLGAGEDSLFTMQLVQRGGRLTWCDESVAIDKVPSDRTSRRWVLMRARSHGNVETTVYLYLASSPTRRAIVRVVAAARGVVRIAGGAARYIAGLASGSLRHQARGLRTLNRGVGIAAGAFGHVVVEYARP